MGSELMRQRSLSPQSIRSNSSTAPSIFSHIGSESSHGTSVRSKDGMAYEGRKGSPVQIFLFKCLKQSADVCIWEAGIEFPGSAELVAVVAKLAFHPSWPMELMHEKNIYSHLTRNPLPIPTCYGVYSCAMEDVGARVGLLLTSLVPGTSADRLTDAELRAVMCVHIAFCTFHSWIFVTQTINSRCCGEIACTRCHPWRHRRSQYHCP